MGTKSGDKRRAWEAPECPECDSDVFVDKNNVPNAKTDTHWRCHLCERMFRPAGGWRYEAPDPGEALR